MTSNPTRLLSLLPNPIEFNRFMFRLPIAEIRPPEIGRIRFGNPKLVPGKNAVREDGLQLAEHVREDETQLGQIPPIMRILVEHLLLALLEQFDRLLALPHQIIDEHIKVFVGV